MNTIKFAPYNEFVTEQHQVERGYLKRLEMGDFKGKVYQPCNLDVLVINACQNHCFFCIKKNYFGDVTQNTFLESLETAVTRLIEKGITLEATITGGEPTLRVPRLVKTIQLLHSLGVKERTVSTTGVGLLDEYEGRPVIQHLIDNGYTHNVSISVMHPNYAINNVLMGHPQSSMVDNLTRDQLQRIARYCNTYGVELRTSTNLIGNYRGFHGISSLDEIIDFVSQQKQIGIYSCLFRELVGNSSVITNCKVSIKPIQDEIDKDKRFEYVKTIDGMFYNIKLYIYTDADGKQYAVKCYQDTIVPVTYSRLSFVNGILRAGFDGPELYNHTKENPNECY